MQEKTKKLPYGISNYRTIAAGEYIYVDKTRFIETIEESHSPFLFFLRPRRFGKSLFTSVLNCYYDVKEKDDFDALFAETHIGKHPTVKKNSYYMLNFDFSGVTTDTPEALQRNFTDIVKVSLNNFADRYGIAFDCATGAPPASMLEFFLGSMQNILDKPLYVVIDEYDHFANELLSFQTDLFKESVSQSGFVRKWYEVLKKYTKTIIERIFATGVSPVALDSMTSGFNIASDITLDEDFNEMMGFTVGEVRGIIKAAARFDVTNEDIDDLTDTLTQNYNGYLFSKHARTRLFNSDMILFYLKTYVEKRRAPDTLIDSNIAGDYAKLGQIFEFTNKDRNMKVLDAIVSGEDIPVELTEKFNMEKDFTADDFKSLLFYMGLLTIDKEELGSILLKVPNHAIKGLYFDYFTQALEGEAKYRIATSDVKNAVNDIAVKGSNERFINLIEGFLSALSNRDYIKFDEKYIKLIMYGYLRMSPIYNVKSEYEVNRGYVDIALLPNQSFPVPHYAIWEVKYIKAKDFKAQGQAAIEKKRQEAAEQLERYASSDELSALPGLKKWALVFVGGKCVLNEEL
jgi:hypothetical protein